MNSCVLASPPMSRVRALLYIGSQYMYIWDPHFPTSGSRDLPGWQPEVGYGWGVLVGDEQLTHRR